MQVQVLWLHKRFNPFQLVMTYCSLIRIVEDWKDKDCRQHRATPPPHPFHLSPAMIETRSSDYTVDSCAVKEVLESVHVRESLYVRTHCLLWEWDGRRCCMSHVPHITFPPQHKYDTKIELFFSPPPSFSKDVCKCLFTPSLTSAAVASVGPAVVHANVATHLLQLIFLWCRYRVGLLMLRSSVCISSRIYCTQGLFIFLISRAFFWI